MGEWRTSIIGLRRSRVVMSRWTLCQTAIGALIGRVMPVIAELEILESVVEQARRPAADA